MGQERRGRLGLARREMRRAAEEFLRESLGFDVPGNRLICDLGTAERKLVQVARALIDGDAKVVVFDEPSAPLASNEVDIVMRAITRLKAQGIAILYVSHYLSGLTDGQRLLPLSLSVGKGEIMGIAGLIGSGREEFVDTLYGLRRKRAGNVSSEGADLNIATAAQAV